MRTEGYVDRSDVVLVLATRGYFQSTNCMRELRRAVQQQKQIVCLLEADPKKGGMSVDQIEEQLGMCHELTLDSTLVPQLHTDSSSRASGSGSRMSHMSRTGARRWMETSRRALTLSRAETRRGRVPPQYCVTEWHVEPGETVLLGQRLCELDWSSSMQPPFERLLVHAPFTGKVVELGCDAGEYRRAPRTVTPTSMRPSHCGAYTAVCGAGEYISYGETLVVWGDTEALAMADALFRHPPIEMNRLGVFQGVTIRMVAERLLPSPSGEETRLLTAAARESRHALQKAPVDSSLPPASGLTLQPQVQEKPPVFERTYTHEGRQLLQLIAPPAPANGKKFHLFVSEYNAGALELIDEVRAQRLLRVPHARTTASLCPLLTVCIGCGIRYVLLLGRRVCSVSNRGRPRPLLAGAPR